MAALILSVTHQDIDDVISSTGSVGLGGASRPFASLVQDYIQPRTGARISSSDGWSRGGDAELDEGNIYECLQEGGKTTFATHGGSSTIIGSRSTASSVKACSSGSSSSSMLSGGTWFASSTAYLQRTAFEEMRWRHRLRQWIDDCPNQLYAALTFMGGAVWRKRLMDDLGDQGDVSDLLDRRSDHELADLMENLGGNCVTTMSETFASIDHDRPGLLPRLYDQGLGHPHCRSQGQSWRPDEQGPDGRMAKAYGCPARTGMGKIRDGCRSGRLAGLSGRSALLATGGGAFRTMSSPFRQ